MLTNLEIIAAILWVNLIVLLFYMWGEENKWKEEDEIKSEKTGESNRD